MQHLKKLFLTFSFFNAFTINAYSDSNDYHKPFMPVEVAIQGSERPQWLGPLLVSIGTVTIPMHTIAAGVFFVGAMSYIIYDEIARAQAANKAFHATSLPSPPQQSTIQKVDVLPPSIDQLPHEFRTKLAYRKLIKQEMMYDHSIVHMHEPLSVEQQALTADAPIDFSSFWGNKFQQLAFTDQREILQILVDLKASSPFFSAKKDVVDILVAAYLLNKEHQTKQSFTITDFCYLLLTCGKSAAYGAQEGVLNAITDIAHHPLQSVAAITVSPAVLGFYIGKMFTTVIGWSADALIIPDKAKKDWADYIKSWQALAYDLKEGNYSLQDGIRTSVAAGTHLTIQYFLFTGLGNLYEKALIKAQCALQTIPQLTPEKYLTTPEGLLLKATGEMVDKEKSLGSLKSIPTISEKTKLIPLGHGSTGRTEPKNLLEKLAMEQIKADPTKGIIIDIKKGMTDPRWLKENGWVKMTWYFKNHEILKGIEIHYVGQWINDVLVAVDDFKFKEKI